MIAPVRPPKRAPRSPVLERARHLLTAALWSPESEDTRKTAPANRWKAWLFGGLLLGVAFWLIYLAIAAEL
jgi:hypothetical protein